MVKIITDSTCDISSVSFISDLGPVVGTHVGPGIFAIGYVEEI